MTRQPKTPAGMAPIGPVDIGEPAKARRYTKGERTRRALIDAALSLMERDGYHDLKVVEVAQAAGLSTGVLYIYFKDKTDLVMTVFNEVVERSMQTVFAVPRPQDTFDAVLETNRRYVSLFFQSGGLNRAISQIIDALPEARATWQAMNGRIARRIAAGAIRRSDDAPASEEARLFTAYALQGMLDTVLLHAVTYANSDLARFAEDEERLTQALSLLWHRALYGRSPDPALLGRVQDFLPADPATRP